MTKSVNEFFKDTHIPDLVLLSCIVEENSFYYTGELLSDRTREYICNSETEFLEKIQEAKLTNML